MIKRTENGDVAFTSTGNHLLDILFMTAYFEKHLNEVEIGDSDKEKLFSMFIRDARFGLGRRDLGRELMYQSNVDAESIVKAGRFDDLLYPVTNDKNLEFLKKSLHNENELAKKWMPRLMGKNRSTAKAICKKWNLLQQDYRKLIKCTSTTEYKMSFVEELKHPLMKEIDFEQVPSLAMVKYFKAFFKREETKENFVKYLDSVKKGKKKLNISTTSIYDIYKNRYKIDVDLFINKIEKIAINCLPILDTSGSMWDSNDSIGKAICIAHYLAKCSTYLPDTVMSFSSKPCLIDIVEKFSLSSVGYYGRNNFTFGTESKYERELNSMYTGDIANTDFAKVLTVLKDIKTLPDYFVVLTDMEFDMGSHQKKNELKKLWEENNVKTKIIWWNFNSRNKTVPETDEMGNIYLSGYSPQMLNLLEAGFDGSKYLDKLLEEYKKNLKI